MRRCCDVCTNNEQVLVNDSVYKHNRSIEYFYYERVETWMFCDSYSTV